MKFKIYCEECEYTFDNESELERKNYIGRDYDLLCCPFCKNIWFIKKSSITFFYTFLIYYFLY